MTGVDLYVGPLNFIFGQADVGGQAAVIYVTRLEAEESRVFRHRVLTEALHELGHNAGLDHCRNTMCAMYLSNGLADTDRKGPNLCAKCTQGIPEDARWHVPV